MATNYENIAVTDFWEQIVVRGTSTENVVICDAQGNSLGKLIDGDEPITENNDGSFTLNFADGTDHTVRIKEFANTSPITFVDGVLTFSFSDGTTVTFTLKVLRDTNPITDNGDGTMTFHFNDNTTFVTPDFQAKEIVSGTGTTVGDNIVIEFERKDETNLQVIVTDARGPQGLAGFQGAYPVMVYRVGTVTSDFTGELTSTFDINSIFSQDNGTPTDWLANKSGVLADGEIYWVRSVLIDPARVDSNEMISLTWGTPYQDESGSGSGDATAGVIQYTDGSGGTRDVAQWIGTKGQYDLLTDGVKNSEILFTITNDQTEVTTASGGLYGDTQVLEYLNNNQYVGGITVGAAQINLLAGKTNADLLNTQRQFGTLNDNIAEWARGDADTALTQVPFGSTARDVASWATGASTQPITGLDGALLEPDLDPDTDATLVTTTDDAGTQTQGTVLVSSLDQSGDITTINTALESRPTFSVGTAFPTVDLIDGQEFYLEADIVEVQRLAVEASGTPITYTQDNYNADSEFGAGDSTTAETGPISRVTWSAARNTWTNWTIPVGFTGDNTADTGTPLGLFLADNTELVFAAGAGTNGDNIDWLRGDLRGDTNVAIFTDVNVTTSTAGLWKYINSTIEWIQITTS